MEKSKPMVTRPTKYQKNRLGRGFSLHEIKDAAIPLDDAQKLNIAIDTRRKSSHDENVQVLSALYRQTISTRAEGRVELDLSIKEAFKELKSLKGIKGDEAKLLIEAGIKSLKALIEENPQSLADDTKIEIEKIEKWITIAKVLLKRKAVSESVTDLMQLKGMNRAYAQRLVDFGILTITDLAQENAEILTKDLKISENIITVWIDDAKRKTGQEIPTTKKQVKKPKGKPAEELKEEIAAAIETKPIEKPKAKAVKKPKAKPVKEVKEEIPSAVQKELVEEPKEKVIAAVEEKPAEKIKAKAVKKPKEKPAEEAKEEVIAAVEEKPAEIPKVKPVKKPKEKPAEEAKEEVKKPLDLPDLKGIGKAELKKLKEVGITKIEDLIEEDPEELSSMTGINKVAVQQWIGDIRAYLGLPREPEAPKKEEAPKAAAPPEDPLSKWLKIEGIGKKIAEKLVKAGIFEVDELLKGDLKALSKKSKISEKDLNKIVESIKKRAAKS